MSDLFRLKILAADNAFFDGMAYSLNFTAPDGLRQVLANHENMVVATKEGFAKIRTQEGAEEITALIGLGFVHIHKNTVTMLVDSAQLPENADAARALEALALAQEKLRQDASIQEYHQSQAALARAMARLSDAGRNIDV